VEITISTGSAVGGTSGEGPPRVTKASAIKPIRMSIIHLILLLRACEDPVGQLICR